MKLFPESAYFQLEFDKIKSLLSAYCETDHARDRAGTLRIHTPQRIL
jgi:DNA mismatch repair protein MutS2